TSPVQFEVKMAPGPSTGPITAAVFSPDGRMIVTAGNDGVLRFWNVSQPRPDPKPTANPAAKPGEKRARMEFRGKPWREVLEWFGQQTGLSISANVRPTGTFTFVPTRPDYTIAEVFDILNEALIPMKFLLIRREATFTIVHGDEPIDPLLVPRVR